MTRAIARKRSVGCRSAFIDLYPHMKAASFSIVLNSMKYRLMVTDFDFLND